MSIGHRFQPLGITPRSTADPGNAFATCTEALRTALANASPSGDAQFRLEDGCVQLASRDEFDSRDRPCLPGQMASCDPRYADRHLHDFSSCLKQGDRGKACMLKPCKRTIRLLCRPDRITRRRLLRS